MPQDKRFVVNITIEGSISTTHSDKDENETRLAMEEWFETEIAPNLHPHINITGHNIQITEI